MIVFKWLTGIFAVVITSLLVLKLLEMMKNIIWVYKSEDTLVRSIQESVEKRSHDEFNKLLRDNNFPFFPGNIWITKWMRHPNHYRRGQKLLKLTRAVFRYPLLMVSCSVTTVLVFRGKSASAIESISEILLGVIIFAGIWTKAVHLLIYRYRFGVADNFLLSLSVPTMEEKINSSFSKREAIQRFMKVIISSLASFLFGYAAVYYIFDNGVIDGSRLKNIDPNTPVWIQTFYFSTATLLTVGFGDISPEGWCALLVVTSEMLLGLLLLVIFITAFSATVPPDD